jgi:hypothetical protein
MNVDLNDEHDLVESESIVSSSSTSSEEEDIITGYPVHLPVIPPVSVSVPAPVPIPAPVSVPAPSSIAVQTEPPISSTPLPLPALPQTIVSPPSLGVCEYRRPQIDIHDVCTGMLS